MHLFHFVGSNDAPVR